MNEQIRQAIESRINNGLSKEDIIKEFEASGYTKDESSSFYDQVTGVTAPVAIPAPEIPVEQSIQESTPQNTNFGEVSTSLESTKNSYQIDNKRFDIKTIIALGVSATALFLVVVVLLTKGLPFNLFAGSAPYKNESDLLQGIIATAAADKLFHMESQFKLALEPKEETTMVLDIEGFSKSLEELDDIGVSVPKEGYVKYFMSGDIDMRDLENPEADLLLTASALLEPIFFDIAGSYRMADGNMYVKVDDLPTLWESLLGEKIPLEQWILIGPIDDVVDSAAPAAPMLVPSLIMQHTPKVDKIADLVMGRDVSRVVSAVVAASNNTMGILNTANANMASVISGINEKSDGYDVVAKQVAEAIIKYPIFAFDGDVEEIDVMGKSVFSYPVKLDYDNLKMLAGEVARISGEEIDYEEFEEVFVREYFDYFNNYVDINLVVDRAGHFVGFSIESKFVLPIAKQDTQVRIEFSAYKSGLDESFDITAPANLYEKSLLDMQAEEKAKKDKEMMKYKDDYLDTRINAKVWKTKEFYKQNKTYEGMCGEVISLGEEVNCAVTAEGFVIYAPYNLMNGYYCVDSLGGSGLITQAPVSVRGGCGMFVDNLDNTQ